ncbi:MAG: hypothetical protein KatS3mg105_3017 [Gemmatales bacterium]|nr:MAG: hypothetical protein KatS3mg105_3017 [Gemmatales bacterium]
MPAISNQHRKPLGLFPDSPTRRLYERTARPPLHLRHHAPEGNSRGLSHDNVDDADTRGVARCLRRQNRAAVRKSDPWDRVTVNRFRGFLSLRERVGVRGHYYDILWFPIWILHYIFRSR